MRTLSFCCIFLFLYLVNNIQLKAQYFENELLKNELSIKKIKELEKAEKIKQQAEVLMTEANKMQIDINRMLLQAKGERIDRKKKMYEKKSQKKENKAIKKRIKANNLFRKSNEITYKIYLEKLNKSKKMLDTLKLVEINNSIIEANQLFEEAKKWRKKITSKNRNVFVAKKVIKTYDFEKQAIKKLKQAISIVLEWNEEVEDSSAIYSLSNNFFLRKQVNKGGIVFKIQLIEVYNALSRQEIEGIYSGVKEIFEEFDGVFYKYLVGNFKTYQVAKLYEKTTFLDDAKIVAFREGNRISLDIAIKETKENK